MDDMLSDQERFAQSLNALEAFASSFVQYDDLTSTVDEAAAAGRRVHGAHRGRRREVSGSSTRARRSSRRSPPTTSSSRASRRPSSRTNNLWATAQAWKTSSLKWLKGSFLEASYIDNDY